MKNLKALVLGLLLVVFGAGWAQAGSETTVHLKFVNDSGKSVPVQMDLTTSTANLTLAAGEQWTFPIKNPAGPQSKVHHTYLSFGPQPTFSQGNMDESNFGNGYDLRVRNQLINGEAQLEGVTATQSEGNENCDYPYQITGWEGAECTVVLTIKKCSNEY